MLQRRIVIPKVLRPIILRHLHAFHVGINGMTQRGRLEVYWPDYTVDIVRVGEWCHTCNVNAPSNPRNFPSQDPQLPAYPFQMICTDFFYMGNKSYLAIVDKYLWWLSIFQFNKDRAINLVKAVREYFSPFGVSETICSDGAKIFASSEFQNFLKMWGVNHRISWGQTDVCSLTGYRGPCYHTGTRLIPHQGYPRPWSCIEGQSGITFLVVTFWPNLSGKSWQENARILFWRGIISKRGN